LTLVFCRFSEGQLWGDPAAGFWFLGGAIAGMAGRGERPLALTGSLPPIEHFPRSWPQIGIPQIFAFIHLIPK
jgi:hypothetical protein